MQTVYEITFAHHIQLEEYRHVPMYYRTSKICPAISIHISMLYFSQQSLLSMCYRTLLTIYILPSYILGSLYFLLPLMTKFGIDIPDYVVIYKGYFIYYNGPPACVLYSTMSSYDYVYLITKAMSSMTMLYPTFSYPFSVYLFIFYFPPILHSI